MAIPSSTIYHLGGGTLAYNSPRKLYLNFRNSLWLTSSNTKIFMWELSAGRRILNKDNKLKYTDIGGTFGFMGYYPKTNLVAPVGLYCTVHANNKLSFRTELLGDLSEFLSKESTGNKFGISVMFSYKLDYFKLKYPILGKLIPRYYNR